MAGTLYIVTTPIGNLQDLTPRAAAIFASADFIAAEDTRVTIKLLNYLGIKKSMISYHKYNEQQRESEILSRIEAGETCALCSDAGVPAISDPGEELVRAALARGIKVVPIPGASAAITALCVSGQDTSRFVFEGFLPQNKRRRAQQIEQIKTETRTIVFYEAPHKLLRTLKDLAAAFSSDRSITLCRELTKLHEEINKTSLQQAIALYEQKPPRGEFVLVVAGAQIEAIESTITFEEAVQHALHLAQQEGLSASDAAKKAQAFSGFAKNLIYKAMQGDRR